MRSFLINKNLSLYYWLRGKIGKKWACRVAVTIENIILTLGRPKLNEDDSKEESVAVRGCRFGNGRECLPPD